MGERGADAPTAAAETNKAHGPEQSSLYRIFRKIDRRVERTLANPSITPEQTQELLTLANLTKLAIVSGLISPTKQFGQQLVELSDPLMIPEETIGKQE